jgi:hypothetical protein
MGKIRSKPRAQIAASPEIGSGSSPAQFRAAAHTVVVGRACVHHDRHGFSPARCKRVTSTHLMEEAIPERVAREVELLFERIRAR